MNDSTNISQPQDKPVEAMNIYQRMNAVMKEVTYIQKGDKKVNNQYRYVSHDVVTGVMHGPLTKWGIVCIPNIVEMRQDGNRTEVKLDVAFINIDSPQDRHVITMWGYGIDQSDKGIGKAVSYAFKYALLKAFCLETGDDPDNDQHSTYEPAEKAEEDLDYTEEAVMKFCTKNFNGHAAAFREYLEYVAKTKNSTISKVIAVCRKDMETFRKFFEGWLAKKSENKQE